MLLQFDVCDEPPWDLSAAEAPYWIKILLGNSVMCSIDDYAIKYGKVRLLIPHHKLANHQDQTGCLKLSIMIKTEVGYLPYSLHFMKAFTDREPQILHGGNRREVHMVGSTFMKLLKDGNMRVLEAGCDPDEAGVCPPNSKLKVCLANKTHLPIEDNGGNHSAANLGN